MQHDRRFAILIGIDNYTTYTPLEYAVKDAEAMKAMLIKYCLFKEEDIFMICSSAATPVSDISGHLNNALQEISLHFVPEQSSLLFYFAGHGQYDFTDSTLCFHDSHRPIKELIEPLADLQPKFLGFIADACESGTGVLKRSVHPDKAFAEDVERFIASSTSQLFMFACQNTESAYEYADRKHGIFTHAILQAFETERCYDDQGVMVPEHLAAYIRKNTMKDSEFKQTPRVEIAGSGYYPLGFFNKIINSPTIKSSPAGKTTRFSEAIAGAAKAQDTTAPSTSESSPAFPVIDPAQRNAVFEAFQDIFTARLQELATQSNLAGNYSGKVFNSVSDLPDDIYQHIRESAVNRAITEKIHAARNLFSVKTENIAPNYAKTQFLQYFASKQSTTRTVYDINEDADDVINGAVQLIPEAVDTPSAGIAWVIYQAIFGIGFGYCVFLYDWDGFGHRKLVRPQYNLSALKYDEQVIDKLTGKLEESIKDFKYAYSSWKDQREKDVAAFNRQAK